MHVLIGPSDRPIQPETHSLAQVAGHALLSYGKDADVPWNPAVDDFTDILSRLPPGWLPDLVIFCSPEYHPVPRGIENADCPTAAIIGDWNLGGQAIHLIGSMFDVLATDRAGSERLRAIGHSNVVYVPFFSYSPDTNYRMEDVVRDLDVVMVGNFHGEIQRDRAPWVARVTSQSDRWKVVMTSGVFGEEYARLMNRAKIVFNRSIRGEINMRVYEAAACGALVLYERENREIRDIFEDGVHCVLYGEDDLEERLDYYLTHEDERAAIAEAGRRAVRNHTPPHKTVDVVNRIAAALAGPGSVSPGARPFNALPTADRSARRASQWLLCADRHALPRAVEECTTAAVSDPRNAMIAAVQGAALFEWSEHVDPNKGQAVLRAQADAHLRRSLDLDRLIVPASLNLSHLLLAVGDHAGARAQLTEVIRILDDTHLDARQLAGPLVPRTFTAQAVDTETAWTKRIHGSPVWIAEMVRIHRWSAVEMLGAIAYIEGDFVRALSSTSEEARLASDRGTARLHHAQALHALGRSDEAIAEYRAAIRLSPLNIDVRITLARLLVDGGQMDDAEATLTAAERIIDGAPCLESRRGDLIAVRSVLARLATRPPAIRGLTLLAFPDWSHDESWQGPVAAYAREFTASEPVSLHLRVDPAIHPPAHALARRILGFAAQRLGLRHDELPDIDLVADPLNADERWKLFLPADVLVSERDSPENVYAEARGLPIVSPHELSTARSLSTHRTFRRSDAIPCLST